LVERLCSCEGVVLPVSPGLLSQPLQPWANARVPLACLGPAEPMAAVSPDLRAKLLISKPLAYCSSLPPHITQAQANDNLPLQMVERHAPTSHRQPPTVSAAAASNLA